MSKVKTNPLLKRILSKLGNTLIPQFILHMLKKKRKRKLSNRQRANKARFLDAVQYANRQMQNAVNKAEYEERITGNKVSAHAVAMADFFHAPEIRCIDTSTYRGAAGETITITATDDFRVTSVLVNITDGDGHLIEEGQAMLCEDVPDNWIYTARAANPVLPGTKVAVAASDKPGNVTLTEKIV